jgi:hypothetical protein
MQFLNWLRHWRALMALVAALGLMAGCATTPQQNPYMLTGAGLGAALGAGLGVASSPGNPWRGAAIGGLLGGAVGGVAGEAYGRSIYPQGYYQGRPYGYYPPPGSPPQYGYAPQPGSAPPAAGGYYSQAPATQYGTPPPHTADYNN